MKNVLMVFLCAISMSTVSGMGLIKSFCTQVKVAAQPIKTNVTAYAAQKKAATAQLFKKHAQKIKLVGATYLVSSTPGLLLKTWAIARCPEECKAIAYKMKDDCALVAYGINKSLHYHPFATFDFIDLN